MGEGMYANRKTPSSSTPVPSGFVYQRPFPVPTQDTSAHPEPQIDLQAKLEIARRASPDLTTLKFSAPRPPAGPILPSLYRESLVTADQRPSMVQTKLTVGAPNDQYEQEADAAAAQVMGMPEPTGSPLLQQRESAEQPEGEEEPEEIQAKPLVDSIAPLIQRQPEDEREELQTAIATPLQRETLPEADLQAKCEACGQEEQVQQVLRKASLTPDDTVQTQPNLESQLNSSKGGGSPLSDDVRSFMEPRFGADLSQVRVHTGSDAVQMNKDLSAQAFTHKHDIFFGAGKSPGKNDLTAHELTHVVQQTGAVQAKGQDSDSQQIESPKTGADFKGGGGESGGGRASDSPNAPTEPKASSDSSAITEKKQDSTKPSVDKVASDSKTPADQLPGDKAPPGEKRETQPVSSDLANLETGNLALVDEELAEHQRWAGALNKVGSAESTERAAFIAESIGGGVLESAGSGAAMGLAAGLASRGVLKLAEKGAVKLVGSQAAKFAPLPAIGAVIGGAMSAYALYERDWKSTKATISRFGEGSSIYETLANSIAAVAEIIDVFTNVLNVIAGVIGAISAAMWIITVATAGLASPLAATLSTIAVGIGTGTMILDTINAMILQPCILLFRSLHTFTSQADPHEVESQGGALAQSAGVMGGALGAFAGGKAAHVGGSAKPPSEAPETKVHSEHPMPAVAAGEGAVVQYETPKGRGAYTTEPVLPPPSNQPGELHQPSVIIDEEKLGLPPGSTTPVQNPDHAPQPSKPYEVDWYDKELNPTGTVKREDIARIESHPEQKMYDASDPKATTGPYQGARGQTIENPYAGQGSPSQPKQVYKPEAFFDVTPSDKPSYGVRVGPGGAYHDHLFSSKEEAIAYAKQQSMQGQSKIRSDSALPHGWAPDETGKVYPGNPVDKMRVFEVPPNTPSIRSVAAPQPEGLPAPGRQNLYPGEGSQVQLPKGVVHPGSQPVEGAEYSIPSHIPGSEIPKVLQPTVPLSPTRQLGDKVFGSNNQSASNKDGEADHLTAGVEQVNPNYPSPPGTPQQIVDFQNEAEHLLSSRAQAEQAEAQMAAEEQKHQANQSPLQQAQQKTEGAISATQAHQQAVTQRQQANQEQQQRQQQSQGLVAGYPSRVAGLTVLTIPLKGFERFTAIGSLLPDSAGNVKQNLLKMNNDAKRFLGALAQMDGKMAEQNNAQPARQQELQGDHNRLQTTDQQAGNSQQDFQKAHEGTQALQESNTQKLNQAIEAKSEAATQKEELSTAAEQKQQQAQTLSEQMQSWAQTHQAARQIAIAETQKRLQEKGFVIRGVQEK